MQHSAPAAARSPPGSPAHGDAQGAGAGGGTGGFGSTKDRAEGSRIRQKPLRRAPVREAPAAGLREPAGRGEDTRRREPGGYSPSAGGTGMAKDGHSTLMGWSA